MTFCKGLGQTAAITTVEGQEITATLRQGKILTSHRGRFFPTRHRDPEKLSSLVSKTYLDNARLHCPGLNALTLVRAGAYAAASRGAFQLAPWWS